VSWRKSLEALRRRFEQAARKHPYFPVYLKQNDVLSGEDGDADEPPIPLSIAIPDSVSPEARSLLHDLARDTVPLLRQAGINPDHPSVSTPAGRWLFWVFHHMRSLQSGEWENAPVSPTNQAELVKLGDNVFYLSAVTLADLATRLPPEETSEPREGMPVDKEAQAIALLFKLGANVTQIARALGVNRTTLYEWKDFMRAYEVRKALDEQATRANKARPSGLLMNEKDCAPPDEPEG
jgi:hypothetical protein